MHQNMSMKTCTRFAPLIMIIIFFFFLPFIISSNAAPDAAAISHDTYFIKCTCNNLQYVVPANCFKWFSRLAGELDQNIIKLVRAALQLSLNRTILATHSIISTYYSPHHKTIDPRAKGALHDCTDTLRDSMDLMNDSIQQVNELYPSGDWSEFQFNISNLQTWLSAAGTDQSTCIEGLDEIENMVTEKKLTNAEAVLALSSKVKKWVMPVGDVTDLTLALVNYTPSVVKNSSTFNSCASH